MSEIKAFIIHLERAKDRQAQVEALSASLPFSCEITAAIDANILDQNVIDNHYKPKSQKPFYPFALSRTEIACFLSHRKAWQQIIDQGLVGAFIFEDDVTLTADFELSLATALPFMNEDTYIRFPFRERESGKILAQKQNHRLIEPCPVGLGQVAQYIGRNCAQKLLDATMQFDRPVDTTLQMFWLTNVRPLSVLPGGVSEISAALGGSTVQKKTRFWDKLRREILRPLYRKRIASLSQQRSL
ncbi:glycosyltransferase family 25 protein [Bartonella sp. HY329]|uniref:glycosyltransferase family 25 protein n=1 Tax=unclassified Bartonella TaxID=2645622 RepID=UPI0021CA0AF9|nr:MULTISPECIES: glycosyltransferase family 25 protein [unclassified Bartonella]UXM94782.1 glycosyltransferase family 25 protein [Bartonella sp. HY329]UXN09105.1 glycosyltransferase family 25 protein [Bartonella sp. HY328]